MATATSPSPEERTSKRLKQDAENDNGGPPPPGAPADGGGGPSQPLPPPQRYPPPHHYPPPPPHMPPGNSGYYPPQYGGPPPPHHWQGGGPRGPPPPGYDSGPPPGWNGGGYRGPPPKSRSKLRTPNPDKDGPAMDDPYYGPPPPGYGPYGGLPPPPPPPQHYHGGGPPPPMYSQGTWTGRSPQRRRDPYRQEIEPFASGPRTHSSLDDDGGSSTAGSGKDKGRGSYKCGRCGVPKKGHVCPYQPKLKRRPDEPAPQTRCAAVQVEMDEFMTLRRLNIQIQGFPESYATEPYMGETMLVGEPLIMHTAPQPPMPPGMPPSHHPHHAHAPQLHPAEMNSMHPGTMPPEAAAAAPEPAESRDTGVGEGVLEDSEEVPTAEEAAV